MSKDSERLLTENLQTELYDLYMYMYISCTFTLFGQIYDTCERVSPSYTRLTGRTMCLGSSAKGIFSPTRDLVTTH